MNPNIEEHIARREEALAEIRQLLVGPLGVRRAPDEIDPDTALFGSGLGLDSIDAVELVVQLDAQFGVTLPNDVFGRSEMRTVNGLVDLVVAARTAEGANAHTR